MKKPNLKLIFAYFFFAIVFLGTGVFLFYGLSKPTEVKVVSMDAGNTVLKNGTEDTVSITVNDKLVIGVLSYKLNENWKNQLKTKNLKSFIILSVETSLANMDEKSFNEKNLVSLIQTELDKFLQYGIEAKFSIQKIEGATIDTPKK